MIRKIRHSQSYSSEDEKRMAGLQYCLQTVPGVSWGRIAGVLWHMEEHTALETVRQYLPPKHGEHYIDDCMYACVLQEMDLGSRTLRCHGNEGTKVHNPRHLSHVVTYTYIHGNMHIICADKSVSVRGSIRKFGKL